MTKQEHETLKAAADAAFREGQRVLLAEQAKAKHEPTHVAVVFVFFGRDNRPVGSATHAIPTGEDQIWQTRPEHDIVRFADEVASWTAGFGDIRTDLPEAWRRLKKRGIFAFSATIPAFGETMWWSADQPDDLAEHETWLFAPESASWDLCEGP